MRPVALLLAALLAAPAGAQVPGECELGRATNVLDVGDVKARVFNTGGLFFGHDGSTGYQAAYEVPKGSGRSPMFAAGLWVGGMADGELRVAGATYADFEFWPGPLDPATGRPRNPEDCSEHDRIWRVSRHDVTEYYRTGTATRDLAEWPHHLGAPVIDADGDSTNYDLAAGDQPAISGDQMLWWVMNDVGNYHANTETPAIGLETRVSVFAFGGGPPALRQATFYRYEFLNHDPVDLDSAYVGLFADVDLGDAVDDFVGSDTLHGMGYVYNSDDVDGWPACHYCYGARPPALGFLALDGPVGLQNGRDDDGDGATDEPGERGGMTAFRALFDGFGPTSNPYTASAMYWALQGRWADGSWVTRGGDGYLPPGTDRTTFGYSGDPVPPRFWSERCPGSSTQCGIANYPSDRGFVASFGPARLAAHGSDRVLFALVYARGESHLNSVDELRLAATTVRNAYGAGYFDARRVPGHVPPALPAAIELRRPVPNPFSESAVVGLTLPAPAALRAAVYDVLGREVAVLANGPHDAGANDLALAGAGLAPGVYVVRVWVNGQPAGALPVTRR